MTKTSTILGLCAASLMLCGACSSDDSEAGSTNLTPFGFLAGNWGVGVTPGTATCEGELYFPQETWMVTNYLASVAVLPIPVTTSGPLPASGTSPQGEGAGQQLPPSFSGVMSSTLHWSASMEEFTTTPAGCLRRATTVLDAQFTADGHFVGTRSVFHEFAGGVDCPTDCRLHFDLQGAKLAQ